MPTLREVLEAHAYMFVKYGVEPDDDVIEAAERLEQQAPHLSRLLRELGTAGGV